jgi:hypothetical protein
MTDEGQGQPEWRESPAVSGHDDTEEAGDGLSVKQAKAIEALLAEPSVARAAVASGVGERTLRRWLTEPTFRESLLRARREAFGQAMNVIQRYAVNAAASLVKIVGDTTAPHSSRVSAAALVLKHARESVELDDLAERVDRLERGTPSTLKTEGPSEGDE